MKQNVYIIPYKVTSNIEILEIRGIEPKIFKSKIQGPFHITLSHLTSTSIVEVVEFIEDLDKPAILKKIDPLIADYMKDIIVEQDPNIGLLINKEVFELLTSDSDLIFQSDNYKFILPTQSLEYVNGTIDMSEPELFSSEATKRAFEFL